MVSTLTTDDLIRLHAIALAEYGGGLAGIGNLSLLEAALGRMTSGWGDQEFYPTLFDKAAALLEGIIHNHPFVDANKRTAMLAAGTFLQLNGSELTFDAADVVEFALAVANKQLAMPEIVQWLQAHSHEYAPEQ